MTRRFKYAVASGIVAVAGTAIFNYRFAPNIPIRDFSSWSSVWNRRSGTTSGTFGNRVPVIQWFDSARRRLEKSIRIDVVDGIAKEAGDERPINDVISFVNARLIPHQENYVVVTAAQHERFGDVFRVVDECRQTTATGVIINSLPYENWRKY